MFTLLLGQLAHKIDIGIYLFGFVYSNLFCLEEFAFFSSLKANQNKRLYFEDEWLEKKKKHLINNNKLSCSSIKFFSYSER